MPVRLFVGNLPYDSTEVELRQHFAAVGPLSHVFIPVDRETGRPRGFAFVEFAERALAEDAIAKLNNQPFKGRPLSVSEARAREDRPAGPRPAGPPRSDWMPRPASGPRPLPGGDAHGPSADGRRRDFGPDAPRRGRAKVAKTRREERPTGPIPIRSGGRIYDVDDVDDIDEQDEDVEFDDFASSQADDEVDDEK